MHQKSVVRSSVIWEIYVLSDYRPFLPSVLILKSNFYVSCRHMYEPFGTDVHSIRLVHWLCGQVMERFPSVPESTVGPTIDSKSEK